MSSSPAIAASSSNQFLQLPEDIQRPVFSFFDITELQSFVATSKALSRVTILETGASLESFIAKVCSKLSEGPQKAALETICPIMLGILGLKKSITEIEKSIIRVLITCSKDELHALEDISLPIGCGDIFLIVEICKSIPVEDDDWQVVSECLRRAGNVKRVIALVNTFKNVGPYALRSIVKSLKEAGNFDQAIDVAKSIQNASLRREALKEICIDLANMRNFDRAIDLANSIEPSDSDVRDLALEYIFRRLRDVSDIDKALDVAKSIQDTHLRETALKDICIDLANARRFDQAIDLANSLEPSDSDVRDLALKSIFRRLKDVPDIDKAIDVAKSMQDAYLREAALKEICIDLANARHFDQAIDLANSIEPSDSIMYTIAQSDSMLGYIFQRLKDVPDIDKAIDVARYIQNETLRGEALRESSLHLAKLGHFERAISLANSIESSGVMLPRGFSHPRDRALRDISQCLVEAKDIDGAIGIASSMISHGSCFVEALLEVCGYLIDIGNIDRAIGVAKSIQDETLRECVLANVCRFLMDIGEKGRAYDEARSIRNPDLCEMISDLLI